MKNGKSLRENLRDVLPFNSFETHPFFTAMPGGLFFAVVLASVGLMVQEYFWSSIFLGVLTLLGSALLFGLVIPPMFRSKWLGILVAGFAAMLSALFVIAVLNASPLCAGQNNGDGNNNFGMCMGHVVLYAFFYGIPYMAMLTVSAFIGNWGLKALSRT